MTLAQWLFICLGTLAICVVFFSYYIVMWKFKLSLFQRWLSLMAFEVLAITAGGALFSVVVGSLVLVPYLLVFTIPFVFLSSLVSWLSEANALRSGIRFKTLAREAQLQGDKDRTEQYERQYKKSVFNIKLFGGAKEIDKIERAYPVESLMEDQTDEVLVTLSKLFRRQPKSGSNHS